MHKAHQPDQNWRPEIAPRDAHVGCAKKLEVILPQPHIRSLQPLNWLKISTDKANVDSPVQCAVRDALQGIHTSSAPAYPCCFCPGQICSNFCCLQAIPFPTDPPSLILYPHHRPCHLPSLLQSPVWPCCHPSYASVPCPRRRL